MTRNRQEDYVISPEVIKINANSLCIYQPRSYYSQTKFEIEKDQSEETTTTDQPEKKPRNNVTNGFISLRAAARLRNNIKYLFYKSGCYKIYGKKMVFSPAGKISFLTLTLSSEQIHDDNYIKSKMLNQFITELTKKHPKIIYIWRAEKQNNGNIHFHFLVNCFVPWKWCRMVWNRIQTKEGYVQRYSEKFSKMTLEEYLLQINKPNLAKISEYILAYKKGVLNKWSNPNSIDVTMLKTAKNVFSYISKYISKNNTNMENKTKWQIELLKVEGHIYFCSQQLTSIEVPTEYLSKRIISELNMIRKICPENIIHNSFFTIIRLSVEELFNYGCSIFYELFTKCLTEKFSDDIFDSPVIDLPLKPKVPKQLTIF